MIDSNFDKQLSLDEVINNIVIHKTLAVQLDLMLQNIVAFLNWVCIHYPVMHQGPVFINDSLKFKMAILQNNTVIFCHAKDSHILSTKNNSVFAYVVGTYLTR